jgi:hypothetical protein
VPLQDDSIYFASKGPEGIYEMAKIRYEDPDFVLEEIELPSPGLLLVV